MIAPLNSAAASLILLAVIAAPTTDESNSDCRSATKQYDDAVAKLIATLHDYENCINNSHGRNECATEIKAVDDAHDEFEDAVADFGEACPKQQ